MTLTDLRTGFIVHQLQADEKSTRPETVVWHPFVCAKFAEKSRNAVAGTWFETAYIEAAE